MDNLEYKLMKLCDDHPDRSNRTQDKRKEVLRLSARLLKEIGFRHMLPTSLKPKHVKALVERWKIEVCVATIKSRMSQIRWWARMVGKSKIVEPTNAAYGIGRRVYVSAESKACQVPPELYEKIDDSYARCSLRLAEVFGLRKEETIKIIPAMADRGDTLYLKDSWCKGGRTRQVPIRNQEQREALDEAKMLVSKSSLIPDGKKYVEQKHRYEYCTKKVGLQGLHGLRHNYAQERYKELTGWECSHRGGKVRQLMPPRERDIDEQAREVITQELGHNRIEVVKTYIGK